MVSNSEGNVGIFAHDKRTAFANIKILKQGDLVEVYGDSYKAVYKVEGSTVKNPTDLDVFYPTKDPILTLLTCDGTFSQKRYILRAKLVSMEELNCN
jgi:LPXTG-site transpeptidase (sortase) family protein